MYAKELIGQHVLRSQPIEFREMIHRTNIFGGGTYQDFATVTDRSWTDVPIKIEKVTETHIYYRRNGNDKIGVLDERFMDNNWVLYEPPTEDIK